MRKIGLISQEFRPDRFFPEHANEVDRYFCKKAWLSFGLGPLKCPGNAFAQQEALLVLAQLIKHYLLETAAETSKPQWLGRLTLRSSKGVWLRFTER